MSRMEEHARLVDDLGGGTKLAKALSEAVGQEIDREAVYRWKIDGVPWKWRFHVAQLAVSAGIEVPKDFIPGEVA